MRKLVIIAVTALVAGCATQEKTIFVRTDGQRASESETLRVQYELDCSACTGRAANAVAGAGETRTLGGAIERGVATRASIVGCMAEKGYLGVPESQALATHQRILAARAEKPAVPSRPAAR